MLVPDIGVSDSTRLKASTWNLPVTPHASPNILWKLECKGDFLILFDGAFVSEVLEFKARLLCKALGPTIFSLDFGSKLGKFFLRVLDWGGWSLRIFLFFQFLWLWLLLHIERLLSLIIPVGRFALRTELLHALTPAKVVRCRLIGVVDVHIASFTPRSDGPIFWDFGALEVKAYSESLEGISLKVERSELCCASHFGR